MLSFLMNGQLYVDYTRISGMLGLPSCSKSTWQGVVEGLEEHVTELAEWSCARARNAIKTCNAHQKWVASFDGFYLTRGHYSNNSSATLHDYESGHIAWFCHRTKRGKGHNWEGTTGAAEGDMFDELIGKAKAAGFVVSEIITDKDSSMNAVYSKHFPEGTITYCANHCAKTLHKDLLKIKPSKCQVTQRFSSACLHVVVLLQCKADNLGKCKRMPENFIGSCTAAFKNLIASDIIQSAEDPYEAFSEGILNFHSHYCLNNHTSTWCHHEKVRQEGQVVSKLTTKIDNRATNIKVPSMDSLVVPRGRPSWSFCRTFLDVHRTTFPAGAGSPLTLGT